MDLPYSQQQQARRKHRSAASLQHLSLVPLTTRLPLRDDDFRLDYDTASLTPIYPSTPSYLQGRSAPATPRLLSKSPPPSGTHSRSASRHKIRASSTAVGTPVTASTHPGLSKSRSTTHLATHSYRSRHGRRRHHRDPAAQSATSTDWLLHAGALVTTETRELKGQSWLTTRASSTSLTGLRDAAEEQGAAVFARELARERELAARTSHGGRASEAASPMLGSATGSRIGSRAGSRVGSRVPLLTPLLTPQERRSLDRSAVGSYFDIVHADAVVDDFDANNDMDDDDDSRFIGPDFVSLDEKLEAIENGDADARLADEATVRRLVKREKAGAGVLGGWLGSVFGWSLFSVLETEDSEAGESDESEDESELISDDDDDDDGDNAAKRLKRRNQASGARRFEGDNAHFAEDEVPPPPAASDSGNWQDAAWLLSVATKVIL